MCDNLKVTSCIVTESIAHLQNITLVKLYFRKEFRMVRLIINLTLHVGLNRQRSLVGLRSFLGKQNLCLAMTTANLT